MNITTAIANMITGKSARAEAAAPPAPEMPPALPGSASTPNLGQFIPGAVQSGSEPSVVRVARPAAPAPRAVRPAEIVERNIASMILDSAKCPVTRDERKALADAHAKHLKLLQAQQDIYFNRHPADRAATDKAFVEDLLSGKPVTPLHLSDTEKEARKLAISYAMTENNKEFALKYANAIRQRLIDAGAKWVEARADDEQRELDRIGIEPLDSPLLATVRNYLKIWKYHQACVAQRQTYAPPASQLTFIAI